MTDRIFNVLFLCTGNSARSIMAEALMNSIGQGRFRAYSAGSHPSGQVHPLALDTLRIAGLSNEGARSKAWDEFAEPGAPRMDFVFTVCDNAAGEVCPIWPGQPMTAHWGVEDPAAFEGTEAEKRAFFLKVFRMLQNRILVFASLPVASLDKQSLLSRIKDIGRLRDEGTPVADPA
jgi:arsenate reductase